MAGQTTQVLFICTGNIFRSMTAEHALRAELGNEIDITVRSAGLIDAPHGIVDFVHAYHAARRIDLFNHVPTRLTGRRLAEATLPIAMGTEHRIKIADQFGLEIPLFSELAYDTVDALKDVDEVVPDWRNNWDAATQYGCSVMDYIFDGMPGFLKRMKYYL